MERRAFLKAAAAFGGLLAARPALALGDLVGAPGAAGAARASALDPTNGLFMVQTDLHNHSLISGDAFGDPYTALDQMRARGIDVACMTEHAISGKGHGELTCPGHEEGGCHTVQGINDSDWEVMAEIADEAYDPGTFVSFRAFEWSTPTVGHLNVWFSREYTDAVREFAFFTPPAAAEIDRIAPVPSEIVDNFEALPDIATMRLFYDWLAADPDREYRGGGNDGIACFNHPNDFGNFQDFRYSLAAAPHVVSFEALNMDRDFFWHRADEGKPNPFNLCLNNGWRVGFTGVSDEHSTEFGRDGMARGGLWVSELTRAGVRVALESRRSFATFEPGLRLDATANGTPMGSALAHDEGVLEIEVDLDRGPEWAGTELVIEAIRPGDDGPTLAGSFPVTVGAPFALEVSAARADGDWVFLRITDPARDPHPAATGEYVDHGGVVAYTSPWFFDPA